MNDLQSSEVGKDQRSVHPGSIAGSEDFPDSSDSHPRTKIYDSNTNISFLELTTSILRLCLPISDPAPLAGKPGRISQSSSSVQVKSQPKTKA